jgi:hypothetical protein
VVGVLTDRSNKRVRETMRHRSTFTPDGRRLLVSRRQSGWSVVCGDGSPVEHEILDVALIEAIRSGTDFGSHSMKLDYATWARGLADRLERETRQLQPEDGGQVPPQDES